MKKTILVALLFITSTSFSHNSYTGGYSGAPGMRSCASSCHGGTSGTLVVTGFPGSYLPGQTYRLTIAHTGGSSIVNFNLTTRQGSTSTVTGVFTPLSNCTSYTGSDGGVYASPHAIDSAVVNWTAPAKGAGTITLYASGFQGSTSSSSGQSRSLSISSTEIVTSAPAESPVPKSFLLSQNYPNPFNPTTAIRYQLPAPSARQTASGLGAEGSVVSAISLKVFDMNGREVAALVDGVGQPGAYTVQWNASSCPSGVYFLRLQAAGYSESRKMVLLR